MSAPRYRVESYADDPGRFYVYEPMPGGYETIHAENLTSLQAAQAEAQRLERAEALAQAAPDLLAALEGMLEWARRVNERNPGPEIVHALNAVAKAKAHPVSIN